MKCIVFLFQVVACVVCATTSLCTPSLQAAVVFGDATAPRAAAPLHATMRALWQGHVECTRAYAFAVEADDTGAAATAADDVVANARQIAVVVGRFYGPAAGKQMLSLLSEHWRAVKAMTDAQYQGDSAADAQAVQDLTANAGAIARFIAGANPYLPETIVRSLLITHGAHHVQQIIEIMERDVPAENATWDMMRAHMDTLADALSDGIAKQFPDKAI